METTRIEDLLRRRTHLYAGGGQERIARHHESGRLTARERLALLFDEDSFQEIGLFARHRCVDYGMTGKELAAEAVVTGHGSVDGRLLYAASQDFTVAGGSVGEAGARKVCELQDAALRTGHPLLFINDSGGARIQEGVDALSGYGRIFYRNVLLSGVVPQISIIAGPCAGGAAYSPALTDFIIQVRNQGQLYITGPTVIKEVTGEDVTAEEIGGVESHAHYSGDVHFVAENDRHAISIAKRLLSYLPSNNTEDAPVDLALCDQESTNGVSLEEIVPEETRRSYDMHELIAAVVDGGEFLPVQAEFARNLIVGFARMSGHSVGVIANQPSVKAGALDIDSSDKAARFIRFCNAFGIPLITFVDVPGFLPGVTQEYGGIIRHGAKMLFAYAAATVPKLTVVLRKAYGGAFLAMCSKEMGADRICAWPGGEIAVMGAEGAVKVLHRRELQDAEDPAAEFARLTEEYRRCFANPYVAAGRGCLDDIIDPAETRGWLIANLEILRSKRELRPMKTHGLIPL